MENKSCVKHKLNFHATRWFNNITAHKVHGRELCFFFFMGLLRQIVPQTLMKCTHISHKKIHLMICQILLFLDSIFWMLCLCKCKTLSSIAT